MFVGWQGIISVIYIGLYHIGLYGPITMYIDMTDVMGTLIDFVTSQYDI